MCYFKHTVGYVGTTKTDVGTTKNLKKKVNKKGKLQLQKNLTVYVTHLKNQLS
jgi:hypothetical protein